MASLPQYIMWILIYRQKTHTLHSRVCLHVYSTSVIWLKTLSLADFSVFQANLFTKKFLNTHLIFVYIT